MSTVPPNPNQLADYAAYEKWRATVQPTDSPANPSVESDFPDTYTMAEGDTLLSVAKKLFGHESNWFRLMLANKDVDGFDGSAPSLEKPGTVLSTDLSKVVTNF